jgi:hypothetical protein
MFVVLGVLAGIGVLAAIGYTRRAGRKAARGMRQATRITGSIVRSLTAAAVITGLEWAIATYVHDWRVLVGVLALPALLAGATVARMFSVTELVSTRRGGGYR